MEVTFEDYPPIDDPLGDLLGRTADDLRDVFLEGIWWNIAPLQAWHQYGEPCLDGLRWAGKWRPEVPADAWRAFQWGCGNYDQLNGFSVSSSALIWACANARAWERAFNSTTRAWSTELVRLCDGQEVFWPDPADALAACE